MQKVQPIDFKIPKSLIGIDISGITTDADFLMGLNIYDIEFKETATHNKKIPKTFDTSTLKKCFRHFVTCEVDLDPSLSYSQNYFNALIKPNTGNSFEANMHDVYQLGKTFNLTKDKRYEFFCLDASNKLVNIRFPSLKSEVDEHTDEFYKYVLENPQVLTE